MTTISWCRYSAIVAALHANVYVCIYKRFVIFPYNRENLLPGTTNVKMSENICWQQNKSWGRETQKHLPASHLTAVFAFTALIDLQASEASGPVVQWSHSLA